jgi:hypothetical protein
MASSQKKSGVQLPKKKLGRTSVWRIKKRREKLTRMGYRSISFFFSRVRVKPLITKPNAQVHDVIDLTLDESDNEIEDNETSSDTCLDAEGQRSSEYEGGRDASEERSEEIINEGGNHVNEGKDVDVSDDKSVGSANESNESAGKSDNDNEEMEMNLIVRSHLISSSIFVQESRANLLK